VAGPMDGDHSVGERLLVALPDVLDGGLLLLAQLVSIGRRGRSPVLYRSFALIAARRPVRLRRFGSARLRRASPCSVLAHRELHCEEVKGLSNRRTGGRGGADASVSYLRWASTRRIPTTPAWPLAGCCEWWASAPKCAKCRCPGHSAPARPPEAPRPSMYACAVRIVTLFVGIGSDRKRR
jgi:hypothetical protein